MARARLLLILLAFGFVAAADPTTPDPFFTEQWSLHNDGAQDIVLKRDGYNSIVQKGVPGTDIGYSEAKAEIAQMARSPVIVAVIDSGIDSTHPELQGRIADGGYNFVADPKPTPNPSDISDQLGHGTETAGVIAANTDNGVGISGITPPTVKILPLDVLGHNYVPIFGYTFTNFQHNGKLQSDYTADAINYAVAHHANVINMSLSWPRAADTQNAQTAVKNAIAAGVMVIAAAGNDGKDANSYPCAYAGVICVGAITNNGAMGFFSNFGADSDVLAPGDNVLTTYPMQMDPLVYRIQGYESAQGTSIAAPQVSALAAIIKSAYPNISMSEWTARILASTSAPPANGALYGLINIKRALEATPRPVYYPHFKAIGSLPVNESTLQVSSTLPIEAFWVAGRNVKAQVIVNGAVAGQAQAATLAPGQLLNIPWSYRLPSLNSSSQLQVQLKITDGAGANKTFTSDIVAVRTVSNIASQTVVEMPQAQSFWVTTANGIPTTAMHQVSTYGTEPGLPKYFTILNPQAGITVPKIDVFDPSKPAGSNVIEVSMNGLGQVQQVFRIDITRTGHFVWAIIGTFQPDQNHAYVQFQFLDDNFRPAMGSIADSTYQILLEPTTVNLILNHPYNQNGSWVLSRGKLVPCFLAPGQLPTPDAYLSFEQQSTTLANHFYYFNEIPQSMPLLPAESNVTNFELRVVDGKAFRNTFAEINLQNYILPSNTDLVAGHLRILAILGHDAMAPSAILDLPAAEAPTTTQVANMNIYADTGAPFYIQTAAHDGSTSAFFDAYSDNARGSLIWVNSSGAYVGRTDFTYWSLLDPIVSPPLLGIFDMPGVGRVWLAESQFNLVSFFQGEHDLNSAAAPAVSTIPIQRDSTMGTDQYAQLFSPMLIGTATAPQPALFMDLTLVRGDYMAAVVTWDLNSHSLTRPARYSFALPTNCADMPPIPPGSGANNFTIPLFCNVNGKIEFRLVVP